MNIFPHSVLIIIESRRLSFFLKKSIFYANFYYYLEKIVRRVAVQITKTIYDKHVTKNKLKRVFTEYTT